ncbi:MAG: heme o synthase [Sandaracinaceae bacterium]|jgi:heme o synthase|nr:MAG: protoheme IX farnesyltransferase [Sandaracinaceae bacterium]HBQ09821.1 protoheme IX farnesyltransferase [Myxococcales bacterium]
MNAVSSSAEPSPVTGTPVRGTAFRDLVALTKPRITLMVILTTAGGLWLAPGELAPLTVLATLLATAMVVGAANTLNCWLEREVDKHMARTKRRPLPAGRLEAKHALWLGLALGAISVPILTFVANPLTGLLAAVALVSYVWVYTPMKQRSPAALMIGAVPGALPPLMGWTAATGELGAPGIVLFGILFLWQMPHFIAISIFRQTEYAKAGIKVLPAVRGNAVAKRHAVLWAAALVPVSLMLVPLGIAGNVYLAIAAVLGLAFFGWSVWGLRAEAGNRWARQLFLGSLIYLPLLFAALALDLA